MATTKSKYSILRVDMQDDDPFASDANGPIAGEHPIVVRDAKGQVWVGDVTSAEYASLKSGKANLDDMDNLSIAPESLATVEALFDSLFANAAAR